MAAVGSYLQAKKHGGEWLLRLEDIDPPREQAGAADDILHTLEAFGFEWDGEVAYQSRRRHLYEAALEQLKQNGALYPCACSRSEIADSSVHGVDGLVYPGTCRAGLPAGRSARAWRVKVAGTVEFLDAVQGRIARDLPKDFGDFVVRRADGFFAYQLAVVVDDAAQGVTEVVRGADLIESTPRQIHLQRLLDLPTPGYLHVPVVLNARGEKLSKQTLAAPLDPRDPVPALAQALRFLGQPVPDQRLTIGEFWVRAAVHWDARRIPRESGLAFLA